MLINFEGHSDDIVLVNAGGESDEFYGERYYIVAPDDSSMSVTAVYNRDGIWCFAPGAVGEDVAYPDWPVSISMAHGYSMLLTIEAPEGSRVESADGEEGR